MSLSEMHLNYLIKILKLNIYESFLADITFVFMRKGESFGVSNCKSARSIEIAMKSVENSVNLFSVVLAHKYYLSSRNFTTLRFKMN